MLPFFTSEDTIVGEVQSSVKRLSMNVDNRLRLICSVAVRSSMHMDALYLWNGSSCNLARSYGVMQPALMSPGFRDPHCRIVQSSLPMLCVALRRRIFPMEFGGLAGPETLPNLS